MIKIGVTYGIHFFFSKEQNISSKIGLPNHLRALVSFLFWGLF